MQLFFAFLFKHFLVYQRYCVCYTNQAVGFISFSSKSKQPLRPEERETVIHRFVCRMADPLRYALTYTYKERSPATDIIQKLENCASSVGWPPSDG